MKYTVGAYCPHCEDMTTIEAETVDEFLKKMRAWAAEHRDLSDEG